MEVPAVDLYASQPFEQKHKAPTYPPVSLFNNNLPMAYTSTSLRSFVFIPNLLLHLRCIQLKSLPKSILVYSDCLSSYTTFITTIFLVYFSCTGLWFKILYYFFLLKKTELFHCSLTN